MVENLEQKNKLIVKLKSVAVGNYPIMSMIIFCLSQTEKQCSFSVIIYVRVFLKWKVRESDKLFLHK